MSKYIRVSEDDREYLTTYQEHCEEVAALQDDGYDFEGCILKQADTIEELCDELVIENSPYLNKPFLFPLENSTNPLQEIYTHYDKETICYGAIWTDKGLIYVAKMNEKGELELL